MTRQKRPILAAFPLLAASLLLSACMPASRVADPALTMKVGADVQSAAQCISTGLGIELRDKHPRLEFDRNEAEITIEAPRGGVLAFVTVEPDAYKGSVVKFYNGELYWPRHDVSGVYPDLARDNWHRVERTVHNCDKAV
jgi:predicted small secreted protein